MLDLKRRLKAMANADDAEDLFSNGGNAGANSDAFEDDADNAAEDVDTARENIVKVEKVSSEKSSGAAAKRTERTREIEPGKAESSRLLEEARTRMGLSPAEVEEITKIRAMYIVALEQGIFEDLPQPVYTLAYLRRLCELYAVSKQEEEQIIAPWNELQFEIPDNYSTTVYSDESGDNRMVIRKLEITIFSVIVLAVIALIVLGVILIVPFLRGGGNSAAVPFDEAGIVKVQKTPVLQISEPLPRARR